MSYNACKNATMLAKMLVTMLSNAGYNETNNSTINEQWIAILYTILLQY